MLVGTDMTGANSALTALIAENGVSERVIAAGASREIPAVMAALDFLVMSSWSESMPVAVVEAMACGTPCVVTDVGDSASIVGDTGWVVPPRDSRALATAMRAAVDEAGSGANQRRGARCRERIADNFSLERMKTAYAELWQRAAAKSGQR